MLSSARWGFQRSFQLWKGETKAAKADLLHVCPEMIGFICLANLEYGRDKCLWKEIQHVFADLAFLDPQHMFQSTAPRSTWQRWQEEAWPLEPSKNAVAQWNVAPWRSEVPGSWTSSFLFIFGWLHSDSSTGEPLSYLWNVPGPFF